jgi:hypothetical protein
MLTAFKERIDRNVRGLLDPRRTATGLIVGMLLLAWTGKSFAVHLGIGNGAGTVGDTVTVVVTTDDLTGLGVYSYELSVTWPSAYASVVDAPVTGTITEPWGPVTFGTAAGQVQVAAAGISPLAGSGTLLALKFVLGPNAGTVQLTFADLIFNEGAPGDTLTNGSLSITALPIVNISPNTGQVLVGDSLLFSASGGTPPYTFTSSNPSIATFGGNAYLKGLTPGLVTAMVQDQNGVTDITSGSILVRALKLTAGTVSGAAPGDTVLVPVTITNPVLYGVVSAEFSVTYTESYLTAVGTSDAGTIASAAAWAGSVSNVTSGKIQVSMAGTSSLAGPGVLVYLKFLIDPVTFSGSATLTVASGLLNETLYSINVNGSVGFVVPPAITVNPNTKTIVVGDQQQFTISGSTTPPVSWGVTKPSVATINSTGQLTATASGTTRVHATDAVGATDTTDVIKICDLYVIAPSDTIFISHPTLVPIKVDRSVTGLGIYGYEMTLTFDGNKLVALGASSVGASSSAWGAPTINTSIPGKVVIVQAGSTPLSGSEPLVYVNFQGLPPLYGSSSGLTITNVLFNEGDPCALVQNGTLRLPTGIDGEIPRARSVLDQNVPNPFNPTTTISYYIGTRGNATLRVYAANGAVIRTLVDRFHEAGGPFKAVWDGTDERGRHVASGVYFYRLQAGNERETKKMVLLK